MGDEDAQTWCEPLGTFIAANAERIIAAWEDEVARLPTIRTLGRPAIRDHLPSFLAEVSRSLREGKRSTQAGKLAAHHAIHRLERGVTLRHVAVEYQVLRRVILQAYAGKCGPSVPVDEVVCLNEEIDAAMTDAVEEFTRAREVTRDQFVNILGHDLRTPLTAIQAGAAYLLELAADEAQRRVLQRIANSADRIGRMGDVLLDLARARLGGGIPVTPAPASMDAIARSVVEELHGAHPGRDIALEVSGDVGGEWDHDRAGQAISNVLANAIEHGGDPIRVMVRGEDASTVVVEITNRGEPIPEEKLPRLFDAYVAGESTQHRRSGLGLGLYIACAILTAHGGSIRARSSMEDGTSFTLRWPRRSRSEV